MVRLLGAVGSLFFAAACSGGGAAVDAGVDAATCSGVCIAVTVEGDGTVAADGLACPTTCVAAYDFGTTVVLRARPSPGNLFAGWSGACRGAIHDCTLDVNGPLLVTATFRPQRFNSVFVTSQAHDGALGGSAGADTLCNQLASDAGLSGSYRAWLSTTQAHAKDRLGGARGFTRVDGTPLFDTQADLLAGRLLNAIRLDETGALVADDVWTATAPDGTLGGAGCGDWTAAAGSAAPAGESVGGPARWTQSAGASSCSDQKRLYCFMVDRAASLDVAAAPPDARQVFVSSTAFTPSSGAGAADAACASDAGAHGLAGRYAALLATSTSPASDRLVLTASYYRGSQYVGTGAEWMMNGPRTGIWQSADGAFVAAADVLTGSPKFTDAGSAATTCADWTAATGTVSVGAANTSGVGWWAGGGTRGCAAPGPVYCVQQ